MSKYVAFLRAINVGGHIVKMDHLRGLFESMGFSNIETFIASGNVIFDSKSKNAKALEAKIADLLQKTFGYKVATYIRSASELRTIADYQPFPDTELNASDGVLYIGFLPSEPTHESKRKLLGFTTKVDEFHISGREVYWLCRAKFSESAFTGARLEKTLGMQTTLRNSNTVKKIASKYS